MTLYHVTYYYMANGMDYPDTSDYGYVQANSAEEAVDKVGLQRSPTERNKTYRNWGLSAQVVGPTSVADRLSTRKSSPRFVNKVKEINARPNRNS